MDAEIVSYPESLRVAWLLIWRGLLINGAIGFVIGFVSGFASRFVGMKQLITPLTFIGGLLGGVFIGSPLLIRMMLRKQFGGFRLQIVRPTPTH